MYDLDVLLGQVPYRKSNGQFPKGNIPANKGKKWDEWLTKEQQEKILSGMKHIGRKDIGGWNRKAIAGVKGDKVVFFESSKDAEGKLGICARNIRSVCAKKRHQAGGIKWFFADDVELKQYL